MPRRQSPRDAASKLRHCVERLHVITIAPYDTRWPSMYAAEAASILQALGDAVLRIEHVGSTSVPGLSAKPVIDIQVSVRDLGPAVAGLTQGLAGIGYVHVPLGDFDLVYPFFQKPSEWPTTHHVHLCAAGGEQERLHLAFRDHLRNNPGAGAAYVALKQGLAGVHHGNTLASRQAYAMAKSDFIASALAQALREP